MATTHLFQPKIYNGHCAAAGPISQSSPVSFGAIISLSAGPRDVIFGCFPGLRQPPPPQVIFVTSIPPRRCYVVGNVSYTILTLDTCETYL